MSTDDMASSTSGIEQDDLTALELNAEEAARRSADFEHETPTGSPSERLPDELVLHAAILVEDAYYGRKTNVKPGLIYLRRYNIYFHPYVQNFIKTVVILHMMLALFEGVSPDRKSIDWFPWWLTNIFEVLIISIYIWDMAFRNTFIDRTKVTSWKSDRRLYITAAFITLTLIDLIVNSIAHWIDHDSWIAGHKLSVFLRPWFVLYFFQSVRHYFKNLKNAVPDILHVFAVLLGIIFFYVLIFLTLLGDSGDPDFSNTFRTFISLYILSTTANFPDILVIPYRISPLYALVFVSYCIIVTKMMLSLLTAVVYNRYGFYIQHDVEASVRLCRKKLAAAFKLLDPNQIGYIYYPTWQQLISVLRPDYSEDKIKLMFHIIDETQSKDLDQREFVRIVSLLRMRISSQRHDEKGDNWFGKRCPRFYRSGCFRVLRSVVLSKAFGWVMDLVVVLNAIQVIVYHEVPSIPIWARELWEFGLFGAYVTELTLKLIVLGPGLYWADNWNKFDVVSVFTSFISLMVSVGIGLQDREFLRFVLLMRTLRLFRFMLLGRSSANVRALYATMARLIPTFAIQAFATMCVFFTFGQLGMFLWGGGIYEGRPELDGSSFSSVSGFGFYQTSNFNTFGNALLTLFELMIQNNWHVVAQAHELISHPVAWLFFLTFNISTAVVIVNVLLAFILDGFINEWKSVISPQKSKVQLRIEELQRQRKIYTEAAEQELTEEMVWTASEETYKVEPTDGIDIDIDLDD